MDPEPQARVLAVDDELDNLETLQRVFRRELELTVASSGAAALEEFRRAEFDVVLADYAMPGMNGIELLREMSALAPHIHRVLLTAHADLREVMAATATGLSAAVVPKPWDKESLLQLITSLARLTRARRASRNP